MTLGDPRDQPHESGAAESPRPARWHWAVLALAAAITAAPVWVVRFFPTMDGPQHLLMGAMAARFDAGGFGRYFEPTGLRATPVLGEYLLRGLFSLGLSAPLAQQIFLTLWIAAGALALGYACSYRHRDGVARAAVGLLLVHGVALSMGFYGFLWSIPFGLAAVGVLLRDARLPPRRWAAFALLLLLSSLAHPFTVMALAPAVLAIVWARGGSWPRVLVSLLPGLAMVAASFVGLGDGTPTPPPIWMSVRGGLRTLAWDGFAGFADTGSLGLVAFGAVAAFSRLTLPDRRLALALLGAALGYGLASVLLPVEGFGWTFLMHRFVPFFWLFGLLTLCLIPARRVAVPVALVLLALGAQCLVVAAAARRFDRGIRELVAGSAAVPRGARLLPMTFDARGESHHPWVRPYRHVWSYVLIERGGMSPYVMATRAIHPFRFRQAWPAPGDALDLALSCRGQGLRAGSPECAGHRLASLRSLVAYTRLYDAVLAWQPPPELDPLLQQAGFRRVHASAHAAVYLSPDVVKP